MKTLLRFFVLNKFVFVYYLLSFRPTSISLCLYLYFICFFDYYFTFLLLFHYLSSFHYLGTGCSLNIVFFSEDFMIYPGLWPLSVVPRCQCVYVCNTILNEHPVSIFLTISINLSLYLYLYVYIFVFVYLSIYQYL